MVDTTYKNIIKMVMTGGWFIIDFIVLTTLYFFTNPYTSMLFPCCSHRSPLRHWYHIPCGDAALDLKAETVSWS
jgi:hypothetical protein